MTIGINSCAAHTAYSKTWQIPSGRCRDVKASDYCITALTEKESIQITSLE